MSLGKEEEIPETNIQKEGSSEGQRQRPQGKPNLSIPGSGTSSVQNCERKKKKKGKKKSIYIYTLFVCLFKSPSQCVVFSYVSQTYSSAKKLEYDIKNIYINALKNNWKLISDVKNFYLRLFSSRNRP